MPQANGGGTYPRAGGGATAYRDGGQTIQGPSPRRRGNRDGQAMIAVAIQQFSFWRTPTRPACRSAPWERGRPARTRPEVGNGRPAEGPPVCSSGQDARAPRGLRPPTLASTCLGRRKMRTAGRHRAYPRAGGGTDSTRSSSSSGRGLSPRRRGNPGSGFGSLARCGPIPAQAGEPSTRSRRANDRQLQHSREHCRHVHGVMSEGMNLAAVLVGLAPSLEHRSQVLCGIAVVLIQS